MREIRDIGRRDLGGALPGVRACRTPWRGSTLILVLAILSILILIAATLSYTARLEELSARNFADGIQARMAAQTGVGWFFAVMDGRTTPVASLRTAPFSMLPGRDPGTGLLSPRLPAGRTAPWPDRPHPPAGTSVPLGGNPSGVLEPQFARIGNLSSIASDLAHLRVVDESSKININAMGSWAELTEGPALPSEGSDRVQDSRGEPANASAATATPVQPIALADALDAVLSSPEVNYRGASPEQARQLARAILAYRYGPDGQPGRAGVDDDGDGPGTGQNAATMRVTAGRNPILSAPVSGRPLFQSARVLPGRPGADQSSPSASVPGGGVDEPDEFVADPRLPPYGDDRPFRQVEDLLKVPGVTPELFRALRPYITVFSASERRVGPERDAPGQLDLNAATPNEIYERLRAAFPRIPVETLAQFAANICDCRDADSVPTLVRLEGMADPILGIEVTPFITEVWPGPTANPFGDDHGKFIELFNPYDTAISMSGWSLRIGKGSAVNLNHTLVPGGFLIITDDYNGRHDRGGAGQTPGYGSFYAIFGLVPNARNHLMLEAPGLEIPQSGGAVELRDQVGNLVDFFRYGGEAAGGLRRSYQRTDPRIRVSHAARCTPYALPGWAEFTGDGIAVSSNLLRAADLKNAPYQSALELFALSAPFPTGASAPNELALRTPQLHAQAGETFDETLVDYFTVWNDGRIHPPTGLAGAEGVGASSQTASLARWTAIGSAALSECGRINLNSTPPPILRAFRGLTSKQIEILLTRRPSPPRSDPAGGPLVFARLSDLLADDEFWAQAPAATRLQRLTQWLGSITLTSDAYLIVTENRAAPPSGPRLASRSKIEALVSTDKGQNQVVFWRYLE